MELKQHRHFDVSEELLEAIRTFPVQREIEHCQAHFMVTPFDFYAECPGEACASRSAPSRQAAKSRTFLMRSSSG